MFKLNKNLGLLAYRFGGSADPKLPRVQDTADPDMRDRLHVPDLSEYEKTFLNEHSTHRRSFTLYNLMSKLPNSVAVKVGKLVSDNKATLASDYLNLPKITANGVPVFDSIFGAQRVLTMENFLALTPFIFILTTHFPLQMLTCGAFAYFGLWKYTWSPLVNSFVVKMELAPQTEEVLIQRVHPFGSIYTSRVKISDLEHVPKTEIQSTLFYRFSRSMIDSNMVFRIKSSGEMLTFDLDGYWHEEGLNHELLI